VSGTWAVSIQGYLAKICCNRPKAANHSGEPKLPGGAEPKEIPLFKSTLYETPAGLG